MLSSVKEINLHHVPPKRHKMKAIMARVPGSRNVGLCLKDRSDDENILSR